MSGRLQGRVAIVTGAGRGLGRAHALRLAQEGAKVVVNDLGTTTDGTREGVPPGEEVVEEIRRAGGEAVASRHDCADWQEAGALVELAVQRFGDLHVLVNNAGILRDRAFANMSEAEWDAVIRVHLKGHAAPSHHALAWWRDRSKAGATVKASVIHTSSIAAYLGNFGQANYAAAKLAVVALSRVLQIEGARYGVRSNAVSPSARTRMMGGEAPPAGQFDPRDPANVSPLVAWLAAADCPANGQYFQVYGSRLLVLTLPQIAHDLNNPGGRWTLEDLDRELASRLVSYRSVDELLADLRGRQAGAAP
jgi:NAD(P)-dependent dehydrogenase (short-subunit alcohol dehydrogenase family)